MTPRALPKGQITAEAIRAWNGCDHAALHRAFGLRPWHRSVLPREIAAYGVNAADQFANPETQRIVELHRALLAVAGWPSGCRAVYQELLDTALKELAYHDEMLRHPERGGRGSGCDPASCRRAVEQAHERVAYRRKLAR